MPGSTKRCALGLAIAMAATLGPASQATGAPAARSAAGNAITATATVDTTYPYSPTAAIRGQITAVGHKYGPRHCLHLRDIFASTTNVAGAPQGLGDADHPTSKNGGFTFSQIELKYGDAGNNGLVPPSGGTVIITLAALPARAPKRREDILNSYKCAPVSTTVTVQVPPEPG